MQTKITFNGKDCAMTIETDDFKDALMALACCLYKDSEPNESVKKMLRYYFGDKHA